MARLSQEEVVVGLALESGGTAADSAPERIRSRTFRAAVVLFAATIFGASGLLFLVQPMFARMVLPRLGGSPSVWNACVLFFQTTLLLGYLYAHLSTKWLGVRRQARWHGLVLLLPLLFLPLTAGSDVAGASQNPVWWLLGTMSVTVGVPFFVLSTSAPLLQRWFAVLPLPSARDPYFLYAASNLGSMLALLGYPFLMEPAFGIRNQTLLWTGGYLVFAGLIGSCLLMVRRCATHDTARHMVLSASQPVAMRRRMRWMVLSFAPSSLMLGVTAHISTDVAAVPLLWVVPLALYLLTFVLAFSPWSGALHRWWTTLTPPLVLATLVAITLNAHAWWFMPLHLLTFFACAMVCHRELAEARPPVSHLTEFYLWISFGGMLGGVFNTLVAPNVFSTVIEYPLILAFVSLLVPVGETRSRMSGTALATAYAVVVACVAVWIMGDLSVQAARALFALTLGLSISLVIAQKTTAFRAFSLIFIVVVVLGPPLGGGTVLFTDRSFFGVVRVIDEPDQSRRSLRHGSTVHGWQRLPMDGRCEPSSYYHADGPVGDMVRTFGSRLRHVAIVGLGTGGMACHAAAGQEWTFYEIDPLMERVARDPRLFTHLQNARADMNVVIGDGRIKLQEARAGQYDMIAIDAFTSDAIPVHLLTVEAVQLYISRLKPDGILAVHISNRYLALEPVLAAIAARERLFALARHDTQGSATVKAEGRALAHWIVLARDPVALGSLPEVSGWRPAGEAVQRRVWTDDYSNIFSALRR